MQDQTPKYKSRQTNTSPDTQIQVQTPTYKSRQPNSSRKFLAATPVFPSKKSPRTGKTGRQVPVRSHFGSSPTLRPLFHSWYLGPFVGRVACAHICISNLAPPISHCLALLWFQWLMVAMVAMDLVINLLQVALVASFKATIKAVLLTMAILKATILVDILTMVIIKVTIKVVLLTVILPKASI